MNKQTIILHIHVNPRLSAMFENIPTYVLAGPLGAGKTTMLKHWLAQRPSSERWAVLVNEFGDIGLDAALLESDENGIAVTEIAGGCVCCVNGAPFTIALSKLIRQSNPDRLLIELSGMSHPQPLLEQLRAHPWAGVLAIQPPVVVLDGNTLLEGVELPPYLEAVLRNGSVLMINKADAVLAEQRPAIESRIGWPCLWITEGRIDLADLFTANGYEPAEAVNTTSLKFASQPPIYKLGGGPAQGWSIGWLEQPERLIDLASVETFLSAWNWERAKMIIHSPEGWRSANLVPGQAPVWRPSEWRRDSRLELIFTTERTAEQTRRLNEEWAQCLLAP